MVLEDKDVLDIHVLVLTHNVQEANQLQQKWYNQLQAIANGHGSYLDIEVASRDKIVVRVDLYVADDKRALIGDIVRWLSEQIECHWIETYSDIVPSNKYGKQILMNTQAPSDMFDPTAINPIFQNLTGQNQVIGIADTGIDTNHCFFYDSEVPVEYNVTMTDHRKLVLYYAYADETDSEDGHGTHVVCLLLHLTLPLSLPRWTVWLMEFDLRVN
jgi:subtilisin family serine protease